MICPIKYDHGETVQIHFWKSNFSTVTCSSSTFKKTFQVAKTKGKKEITVSPKYSAALKWRYEKLATILGVYLI